MDPAAVETSNRDVIDVVTIPSNADLSADAIRRRAQDTVEGGGVVLLPQSGFELTAAERRMISDTRAMLSGIEEEDIQNGRPTIIYEPSRGKIKNLHYARVGGRLMRAKVRPEALATVEGMMTRFGTWADEMIATLFPSYRSVLVRDRITYRPHQRSSKQPLHVDSSYGFPTQGRGMFRLFCNIDPMNRPRVWQVGERFEPFARRFIGNLDAPDPSWSSALLARLGFVRGAKTPYDMLIAELRQQGKADKEYQSMAPRRVLEFPSGAAWFAITDLVLHGAISGQHSLDQTFFLPADGMQDPSRSSLRILERMTGRALV